MSKFVIQSDEARMLAKAHLEQCREFVKRAKEWRSNASWPDHIEGMWDYLKWARQEGERAKYWYKKLGLTFGTPALRSDEPPKDGRCIRAVGQVVGPNEFGMAAEPFSGVVLWSELPGQQPGWHFADKLSVAQTLEDVVTIHRWAELPAQI